MRLFISLFAFIFLLACKNDTTTKTTNAINEPTNESKEPEETVLTNNYCFISSYGVDANYQDTTAVKLTIIGN